MDGFRNPFVNRPWMSKNGGAAAATASGNLGLKGVIAGESSAELLFVDLLQYAWTSTSSRYQYLLVTRDMDVLNSCFLNNPK